MEHTLQECRMNSVLDSIGVKSQSAIELFSEQSRKWSTNLNVLDARSEAWRRLKQMKSPDWTIHLPKLLENELVIRSLDPATASESQTEDWSQILFTGEFSCFNFVPFVLMYVALSKIFIAPLIAWCMPLMSLILPFLALKFVYGLPITWDVYWLQMKPMIFGRADQPFGVGTLLQWGSMIFSYAHGMYLPYTNAVHCYNIDEQMVKGAKAVVDTITRLRDISYIWVRFGLRKPWTFPDPSELGDDRQVLAWLVQDKSLLPQIYRAIGQVEITAAISRCDALVPVEWTQSSIPLCKMSEAVDPLLPLERRVPFHLVMGPTEHHVICTGPNRGGKSTFLRSILTNVVLAHTWGVSFSSRCLMTPVEWVISSLRLEDRPGQASLFEREVSVAGDIVERIRDAKTRGWVIIDELFHTTNPPDAATASQIFLRQLWSSNLVTSIVSTHLFSHAEEAPSNVQRLCVDTSMNEETGRIIYKYEVVEGINKMSSVEELLIESKVLVV
uniref:DNA mismatch repair proteins mutS family domain-containing protein n=1 Tax=viral metagenome TaxID=1070528 RepID=A0A6C0DI72_9ZZZZ